jgi:cell division protein FtsW (lipid II flippase)
MVMMMTMTMMTTMRMLLLLLLLLMVMMMIMTDDDDDDDNDDDNDDDSSVMARQMNKAFTPGDFQVDARLATVMNTIVVCLLFSAGLPLLIPFAFAGVGLTYLLDKVRHPLMTTTSVYQTQPFSLSQ